MNTSEPTETPHEATMRTLVRPLLSWLAGVGSFVGFFLLLYLGIIILDRLLGLGLLNHGPWPTPDAGSWRGQS